MRLQAGLLYSGLLLALLPCCFLVRSENQQSSPGNATSNGTSHTATAAPVNPAINITTTTIPTGTKNVTLSTAVPSNTTTSATVNATTATTVASTTTVKTSATKTSPTLPTSPNVTTASKAPSSNSTTVTVTPKAASTFSRTSGFDVGSFIGGIVLTLGLLIIGYIGCRTYHAKRGVQYRTIDEHDAII
ncbi:porimin [Eublepharis macularius]|uniref:Porimin n=1 Tax=Eublepharis macularius TaxID=481883 RepID=A0AA97J1N7_EUBMA|nr:porimin [Eublepharis macularius]